MYSVHISSVVSPRYVSNRDLPLPRLKCDMNLKWFLMRISYGRERRVYEYLKHQGFEVFYPYEKSIEPFKIHDKVRVTDGPFKGLIGNVVRFKGQTRVGINIDEVGFICTNYVPKSFLEKV